MGLSFEAVSDEQLRRFLAEPSSSGATVNRGRWRYSHHPNFFGDGVVWCGFYIVACATGWGSLSVLPPVLMIWRLTSLSGKPMLGRKPTTTRAGHEEYVATTVPLVPRPTIHPDR